MGVRTRMDGGSRLGLRQQASLGGLRGSSVSPVAAPASRWLLRAELFYCGLGRNGLQCRAADYPRPTHDRT
jgi:hypothetical protein